ncbi:hypothetical protein AB4Z52_17685 [Rhizobium sp. 2YAF20]|uniref:hypothetical protein n=1 Tax=Rhizobium sp. 2YAF20 TaxID=3233027 RepID=UPI003F9A06DC
MIKSRFAVIAVVATGGALLPIGALFGEAGPSAAAILPDSQLCPHLDRALYLVAEEILVEAHHEPDTPVVTIMIFVGFLGLLALEIPNG